MPRYHALPSNSVPKHAATSGKAPWRSVVLRVLRVRSLQQSAPHRPCIHCVLAVRHPRIHPNAMALAQ
jgi:hypothetical protein